MESREKRLIVGGELCSPDPQQVIGYLKCYLKGKYMYMYKMCCLEA